MKITKLFRKAPKKNLALFDIDGVLADDRHRVPFALKRDYYSYFAESRMFKDGVWQQGMGLVREYEKQGWEIQYLTGRRDDRAKVTQEWLTVNGFPAGKLNTKPFREYGRLAEYKSRFIRNVLAGQKYDQVVLFDDDPEVIGLVEKDHGAEHVVHCTWYIKEKAMIRTAKA